MPDRDRLLKVPQDRETPVQVVRGRVFTYRLAYARAAETRVAGDVGQDYLAMREGERSFVFALCDGVSQSFYGDLAARYLGDALVTWLSDGLPPTMELEAIRAALTTYLHDLTGPATEQVRRHPLPSDIPQMLRDVLEEKRALGSESTFVCGRVDLPGGEFPAGRVVLAWMGDSRLRLWGSGDGSPADLGGVFETAQRWSSRRGPVGGDPHVFVAPLVQAGHRFNRLMAYSDGLAALDDRNKTPSNHALQDLITRAGEAATSDDISFLEVWLGAVPAHIEAAPAPAPHLLEVGLRKGHIRVAWRRVLGADQYEVEVRDGKVRTWQIPRTDWESPVLPPGEYRLRVRAWKDEEPGEWSEERRVTVPEAKVVPPPSPKPTAPQPVAVAPPTWKVPVGLGCVVMAMAFIVLAGIMAVLTLPEKGPFHGLIFIPTPTAMATTTPTAVPTSIWTPTAAPAETPTPTLPTAVTPPTTFPETPTQALTATLTPIETEFISPLATPILTPTYTSTPTPTQTITTTLSTTSTLAVIVTPTGTRGS